MVDLIPQDLVMTEEGFRGDCQGLVIGRYDGHGKSKQVGCSAFGGK